MKNFAMLFSLFLCRRLAGQRLFGGIHQTTRASLLQAFDDDPITGVYALRYDVILPDAVAESDAPEDHLVIGSDDVNDIRTLHLRHSFLRDEEGIFDHTRRQTHAA